MPLWLPPSATHPHGLPDHAQDRAQGLRGAVPAPQRPAAGPGPSDDQRPTGGPGQQGPQGPRGPDPRGPARRPGRLGLVSLQGPQASHAGHLPPVGRGEHEASGRGCRDRPHPHAFRHTYGRTCVLRGIPVPVLQQWLGHQSLADTQRYVELAGAQHSWVTRL